MARELVVVWAGRHRRDDWERLCAVYRRRIRRHLPLREAPVRVGGRGDDRSRRRQEGTSLLASLPSPCWSVAVDSRGVQRGSEELSRWLERLIGQWPHPIAFLLGSDVGLDDRVLREARDSLSFGPMTLAHELARLVLYEQLYRALSIAAGINYHRRRL